MAQVQHISCDCVGCDQPAKFRVNYSWTPDGEGYNLCENDLNAKDEQGHEYFRRTAKSIISLEAVQVVQ